MKESKLDVLENELDAAKKYLIEGESAHAHAVGVVDESLEELAEMDAERLFESAKNIALLQSTRDALGELVASRAARVARLELQVLELQVAENKTAIAAMEKIYAGRRRRQKELHDELRALMNNPGRYATPEERAAERYRLELAILEVTRENTPAEDKKWSNLQHKKWMYGHRLEELRRAQEVAS